MKPQIVVQDSGYHNRDLARSRDRIVKGHTYKNVNTACVVPTRGMIPAKVVQSWMGLMSPMNSAFVRIFMIGMEVGEAYSQAFEHVLKNLPDFKFILTLEEDNLPPPDGLLRLHQAIEEFKLDAVGGLYWTKGEGGQPMIYGSPTEIPLNFRPQPPIPECVQPCRGLGMGFSLFRTAMFKDERLEKPWFKTVQTYEPGKGAAAFTQDLRFFENAGKLGFKFASDNRVKVGHIDAEGFVW